MMAVGGWLKADRRSRIDLSFWIVPKIEVVGIFGKRHPSDSRLRTHNLGAVPGNDSPKRKSRRTLKARVEERLKSRSNIMSKGKEEEKKSSVELRISPSPLHSPRRSPRRTREEEASVPKILSRTRLHTMPVKVNIDERGTLLL